MKEHEDVLPVSGKIEARAGKFVKFKKWHTFSEFDGFFGILFYFLKRGLVFDARFKFLAKADFFADFSPIILILLVEICKTGFAGFFKEISPNCADGVIVIVPEFTFRFSTISSDGGVA